MERKDIELNYVLINSFLRKVNCDFPIPLDKKVNIDEYTKKILKGTIKAYLKNNEIIGLVAGYTENITNNSAYISIVAIDKNVRGNGIAGVLIQEFIDVCKQKNIKSINLYTHKNNYVAIKMYKKLGFEEDINENNTREDDIHFIYNIL